mgnify:CR=1 FL=1
MMDVSIATEGDLIRVAVSGSLNTNTSRQLEEALDPVLGTAPNLVFDLSGLDYISSAGLRVLMVAYKRQGGRGVVIEHPNDEVREVFDITGFSTLFEIR